MEDYRYRDSSPMLWQLNSQWLDLLEIEDRLFVNRDILFFEWTYAERRRLYESMIKEWERS